MKRTFTLLLLLFAACIAKAQDWEYVGTPMFSDGPAELSTLKIDPSGTPYVAYTDYAYNAKSTVKKFDGTSWVTVGNAGFTPGYGPYMSLAFDTAGTPYIAYADQTNNYKTTVMMFNGTSWVGVGSAVSPAPSSLDALYFTSLAIDASGVPYLAYRDDANGLNAMVKKFNGTSWVTVGTAGLYSGSIDSLSLAFDASGSPYLAFSEGVNGYKATVMKFNGTSWETVGNAGFTPGGTIFPSIAIDASGTPYVAYNDETNGYKASVMKFNGTSWVTVGNAGFSTSVAQYLSFALSASGTPYVAYMDDTNGYKTSVMKFNGFSWGTVGTSGVSSNMTYYSSIAIDASGAAYVGFTEGTGQTSVKRFAAPEPFPVHITNAQCGATVGFTTSINSTIVANATAYLFRVSLDGGGTEYIQSPVRSFKLNMINGYGYGQTYVVNVAAFVNGAWTEFGTPCRVSTPAAITQLKASSCGITVASFSTNLYANPMAFADGYRFRITNGENVQTIDGTASYFRLKQLYSYEYNTEYTVDVAVSIGGIYGAYGPACTVTTPAPITQLRAQDCGITVAGFGTNLYADAVVLAEGYRFRVTNGATVNIVNWPTRNFRIKMLPSYSYNTTYTIEVAVMIDGVYGPYGPSCEVSTPSSGMRQNMANDEEAVRELTAFPNPFETSFTLAFETESNEPVTIQAYDITGKMLDNRTIAAEELSDLKIGENYASGIYSVIVTQGSYTKVVKMVKK